MKWFIKRAGAGQPGLFSAVGLASVMGLHLVSGILVGGLIGYWLDRWLGTSPWLKIVFFLLGVAAGFLNVYRDAQKLLAAQDAGPERGAGSKRRPEGAGATDGGPEEIPENASAESSAGVPVKRPEQGPKKGNDQPEEKN